MLIEYTAINADAEKIDGLIESNSIRSARRALIKQNLQVINLQQQDKELKQYKNAKAPSKKDLLMVLRQLSVLIASGVSIGEAVESISESSQDAYIKYEFNEIARQLNSGSQLSEAVKLGRLKVPDYIHHLLQAGEASGHLAQALREGVDQMEYEQKLANEFFSALIYPVILIVSGISAVLLIFVFVVPKFSKMLEKNKGELPWLADTVLSMGQFFNTYMIEVGIVIVLFVMMLITLFRQKTVRQKTWDIMLKMPHVGPWLFEADIARWSAMLATLLNSKVSLILSLELAQNSLKSGRLKANMSQVLQSVKSGNNLADSLQDSATITATGYGLIRVGERTGELPSMLKSLSSIYTSESQERMKRLLALLEPLAILLIGGVIGVIMTGIVLAITSVNEIPV